MKSKILILLFLIISKIAAAQEVPTGLWLSADKDGKLQFYKSGNQVFAKVVWIKENNNADGTPRTDINNPEAKNRKTPILGLTVAKNMKYKGNNLWEGGTIYDTKNGKTYSLKMTQVNENRIELRGFIGFSLLGRSSYLTRVK